MEFKIWFAYCLGCVVSFKETLGHQWLIINTRLCFWMLTFKMNTSVNWCVCIVEASSWVKRTIQRWFRMPCLPHCCTTSFLAWESCLLALLSTTDVGPQIGVTIDSYFTSFLSRSSRHSHRITHSFTNLLLQCSSTLTKSLRFSSFWTVALLIHIFLKLIDVWWNWMVCGFIVVDFCLSQVENFSSVILVVILVEDDVSCFRIGAADVVSSTHEMHISLDKFRIDIWCLLICHIRFCITSLVECCTGLLLRQISVHTNNVLRISRFLSVVFCIGLVKLIFTFCFTIILFFLFYLSRHIFIFYFEKIIFVLWKIKLK